MKNRGGENEYELRKYWYCNVMNAVILTKVQGSWYKNLTYYIELLSEDIENANQASGQSVNINY